MGEGIIELSWPPIRYVNPGISSKTRVKTRSWRVPGSMQKTVCVNTCTNILESVGDLSNLSKIIFYFVKELTLMSYSILIFVLMNNPGLGLWYH